MGLTAAVGWTVAGEKGGREREAGKPKGRRRGRGSDEAAGREGVATSHKEGVSWAVKYAQKMC